MTQGTTDEDTREANRAAGDAGELAALFDLLPFTDTSGTLAEALKDFSGNREDAR